MTPDQGQKIIELLEDILTAIKANGTGGGGNTPAVMATPKSSTKGTSSDEVPQPSEPVPNAGAVAVHFGKNNGVPLSQLSDRSLSWYAQEQAPRLDSSGNPYPPRPQEVTLRNAARTLWHQKKGTLQGAMPADQSNQGEEDDDSNVPF